MSRRPPRDKAQRQLPHDVGAEASVLGGIILSNEALALTPDLEVEDFYDHKHKVVFQAIRNLEAAGTPIDVVTLETEITRAGKIDAIGGAGFLGELALRVPTVDNVEAYASTVVTKHISRQVILRLSDLLDQAYLGEEGAEGSEGEQLCHDVSAAMLTIRTRSEDPILTMAELIAKEAKQAVADGEAKLRGEKVYVGVPSGITALDHNVGGIPIGIPTLIIARPGNGKSLVAMSLNEAAQRSGFDSLLATYEDSGQSFAQRGLAKESDLSTQMIRARRLDAPALLEIMAGWAASSARTEQILVASGMTVEALVRRVRREVVRRRVGGRRPLRQVIVDYAQKIPNPRHARNRDEGLAYISQQLSDMFVRENLAGVICCQLNREVEKRDDHRPRLSDIRDSGSLEQDGKLIIGLYIPSLYEKDRKESELVALILKNHQGEAGIDIKLFWDVKSHAVYDSEMDYQQARALRRRASGTSGIDFASLAERFKAGRGKPDGGK